VLSDENRRDLLELLEDRRDCRATLVPSQLPVEHWHEALGEPTLADAILDRLVHNAYKIALKGDSMRKRQTKVTHPEVAGSSAPFDVALCQGDPARLGLHRAGPGCGHLAHPRRLVP
jgi:hypothetical protein